MKFRSSIPILLATLGFLGAVAIDAQAQTKPSTTINQSTSTTKKQANQKTEFVCKSLGKNKGFGTFPKKGKQIAKGAMIEWKSNYFGPEYTPEQRCQTVSNKLTTVVSANGGSIKELLLTTGRVNNYSVICYIDTTPEARCNNDNVLFTLHGENAKNPGAALGKILRFSATGSGNAVHEDVDGEDGSDVTSVNLEQIVDQAFSAGSYESADGEESADSPASTESQNNNQGTEGENQSVY